MLSEQASRHRRFAIGGAIMLLASLCVRGEARQAQVTVDDPTNQKTGFSVQKEDRGVTEALAEFGRYAGKAAWEKAFASLGKVMESQPKGLTPGKEAGVFLPTRVRLRQLLIDLPPEGKEAFRLFNDAKAKQLFAQLNESANGSRTKLEDLYDEYFITSIGDQIADRLGDALFEHGDFNGAATCWGAIISDYPESTISPLKLRAKRAIALLRAGRADEFSKAREEIRQRYSDQPVHFAGKDSPAVALLDELEKSQHSPPATQNPAAADDPITLPSTDDPLWQFTFADDRFQQSLAGVMSNGWWGAQTLRDTAPVVAADERRIYLNWFGIAIALDAETGKVLWNSDALNTVASKIQQMAQSGASLDDHAIATVAGGERVLFVRRSLDDLAQQQSKCELICLASATGKRIWNSEKGSLASWSFAGQPIVRGEIVYAVAHAQASMQLNLLAISLSDGSLKWKSALGTAQASTNFRGMPVAPVPVMREHAGNIYVLVNQGALIAVNTATQRTEWALTFGAPQIVSGERIYYGYVTHESPVFPANMLVSESRLYMKDKTDGRLYAMDLSGPSLKWSRPVEPNEMLLSVDDQSSRVMLAGEDLDCIDLASRDLLWSEKTPADSGFAAPIVAGAHAYQFGSRGVYDIDLRDGTRTIFRGCDLDGAGGAILRVGGKLITVSGRNVTGYQLVAGYQLPDANAKK